MFGSSSFLEHGIMKRADAFEGASQMSDPSHPSWSVQRALYSHDTLSGEHLREPTHGTEILEANPSHKPIRVTVSKNDRVISETTKFTQVNMLRFKSHSERSFHAREKHPFAFPQFNLIQCILSFSSLIPPGSIIFQLRVF